MGEWVCFKCKKEIDIKAGKAGFYPWCSHCNIIPIIARKDRSPQHHKITVAARYGVR